VQCGAPGRADQLWDREYFQRALTTSADVAMSGYLIGRISRKAPIVIAHPAVDARGTVSAVVVIGLDLPEASIIWPPTFPVLPQAPTLSLVIDQAGVHFSCPDTTQGDEWVVSKSRTPPSHKPCWRGAARARRWGGIGRCASTGNGLTRLAATPDAARSTLRSAFLDPWR